MHPYRRPRLLRPTRRVVVASEQDALAASYASGFRDGADNAYKKCDSEIERLRLEVVRLRQPYQIPDDTLAQLRLEARTEANARIAEVEEDARELAKQRDAAIARAERAEECERSLRAEIEAAFRKHGLAAGPTALDAVIRQRAEANAENADLAKLLVRAEACIDHTGMVGEANRITASIVEALRADIKAALAARKEGGE